MIPAVVLGFLISVIVKLIAVPPATAAVANPLVTVRVSVLVS